MNDNPAPPKLRAKKRNGQHVPKPAAPERIVIRMDEPETDDLRRVGGSRSDKFNNALVRAVTQTGWFPPGQSAEARNTQLFVSAKAMMAFEPADEIEAMLAAQAMAQHNAAMECSRRAMLLDQPAEIAHAFRKSAANSSQIFINLLAALDRKRGKNGQQSFRVEHVHVNSGAQAIIGNVGPGGGGGAAETAGEPREPGQLAQGPVLGAVIPPLLCADPQRDGVPGAGDAEPAVLPARGKQHRTPNARRHRADTAGADDPRAARR
jgi:hypothetical protein